MRDKWITNPTWTLFYIYTGAGCYSNPILFINTICGSARELLSHTLLHSGLSVLLSAQNRHGPTSCPACQSSWVISLWPWLWLTWTSLWAQDCRAWNRQALQKSWLSWEVQTRDTERKHLIDQHQRAVKWWTWNRNREFCSELDHIDSSSPSGHFCSVKVKIRKSLTEHEDPFLEVLFLTPPQLDTWMQDPQKVDSGICLS